VKTEVVIPHIPETGCKTRNDIFALCHTRSFVLELLNLTQIYDATESISSPSGLLSHITALQRLCKGAIRSLCHNIPTHFCTKHTEIVM